MYKAQTYYTEDGEYVFSVNELNLSAKDVLEDHFQTIWVTGEVSNFSRPASGHIYFSLKDDSALIRCAWFRGRQSPLGFQLENGLHVILVANVTLYPEKGEYQLLVQKVQLAGEGLIKQKLDALKRKLAAEGLFAPEHKKALIGFPNAVGVITSSTGAALQDVLTVLKRRAPFIQVYVYPCQVQGVGAADSIKQALERAIVDRKADALLLTRGGGSNEDLFAFNDEKLAYAIYNCPIPIVSAVGHEIDLSIADFVADLRAATPSAAAELMSPNIEDLFSTLNYYHTTIKQSLARIVDEKIKSVAFFSRLLVHPSQKLHEQQQLLEQTFQKLNKIIHNTLNQQKMKINFARVLLQKNQPQEKIFSLQRRLQNFSNLIQERTEKVLNEKKFSLFIRIEKLETLSPISTLSRGYAILYTEKNKVLSDVKMVRAGEKISAQLKNGQVVCIVEKTTQ